jgi:transposase
VRQAQGAQPHADLGSQLAVAVRASGTSLTDIFGVGPIAAATVIGGVREVSRFPNRDPRPRSART